MKYLLLCMILGDLTSPINQIWFLNQSDWKGFSASSSSLLLPTPSFLSYVYHVFVVGQSTRQYSLIILRCISHLILCNCIFSVLNCILRIEFKVFLCRSMKFSPNFFRIISLNHHFHNVKFLDRIWRGLSTMFSRIFPEQSWPSLKAHLSFFCFT